MPTLLVVEDQELICGVIRQALATRGHDLLTTGNATQALAIAAQHDGTIDLLITDVVLDGSSGMALAARLRDEGRVQRTLFMSGYDRDELPLAADAHFLPKPFTMRELVDAVDKILKE
jgi:two-component system cell cycle sensor histidine kinase/response regulator CckA